MSDRTPNDSLLVFAGFLELLSGQGFTIGVDDHLRLQKLLNKISGNCAPDDLKTLLCPIFATDKTQQDRFYLAFDSYFGLFQSTSQKKAAISGAIEWHPTVLGGCEPLAARKWPYVLAGAAVVLLILVSGLYISPKQQEAEAPAQVGPEQTQPDKPPPQLPDQQPSSSPKVEKPSAGAAPQPAVEQTEAPPQPISEPRQRIYQGHRNTFLVTAISALLVGILFYAWYRFNRRKLVLQRQLGKKPPYVWPLRAETRSRPFDSEQFYTAARLMRSRQVDEYYQVDVNASVAATIGAMGYPSFRYKAASKMPDYLVLIERTSFRDHQAQLFNELFKALEQEAVFLVRYFYDGDPRVCRTGTQDSIHLVELQRRYPLHRLLILGSGDGLIDPITGRIESWASIFSGWPERAVLTPEIPSRWGAREVELASEFILAPATLDGLTSLIDQFASSVMTDLRFWRPKLNEEPPGEFEQSVESLRSYLGEGAFKWLCACAIYPELHWDLTVYLGSAECMREGLVREENLRRLVRLPWFRSGTMPDDLRWLLIRQLDEDTQKAVHLAIIDLLQENPPPKESFAYDNYQFDLVVQQWLCRRDRKSAREALRRMKELPRSQAVRDYTLLRFLDSSRISPLDMVLPWHFRRRLNLNWELLYSTLSEAALESLQKPLAIARSLGKSVHRWAKRHPLLDVEIGAVSLAARPPDPTRIRLCPKCKARVSPIDSHCTDCNWDLSKPWIAPPVKERSLIIYAASALAALLLVWLLIVGVRSRLNVDNRIIGKIQSGQLVTPVGTSAYDMWLAMRSSEPNSPAVSKIGEQALPALRKRGDQVMQAWHDEARTTDEEFNELARIYEWATAIAPDDDQLRSLQLYCKGQIAFRQKRFDDAIRSYQQALQHKPCMSQALNGIGRVYSNKRDFRSAENYYKQALQCDPGWCYPLANLGGVYLQTRDYLQAEMYYSQAISCAPNKPLPHYQLAQLYEALKRTCDELSEYKMAIELISNDPDPGFTVDRVRKRIEQLKLKCN